MHMQKFFIILRFWGMGRQITVKVISSLKAVATLHCKEYCAPAQLDLEVESTRVLSTEKIHRT
jgi:hypothetical protein